MNENKMPVNRYTLQLLSLVLTRLSYHPFVIQINI